MEEKIKVTLDSNTYNILLKDCENFLFYKGENNLNRNLFINTLINNYYEEFSALDDKFRLDVFSVIKNISDEEKEEVYHKLVKVIDKKNSSVDQSNKSVSFLFKPTKISSKAINFILNSFVKNESISSYFRRLFTSYSSKVQSEREKIIFKQNYALLCKSIDRNVKVYLSLTSGAAINEASLYTISSSKDELFNYGLFVAENGILHTVRLAKIKDVILLTNKRKILPHQEEIFNKQIKYGIQYSIKPYENEEIKVQLTPIGKEMFKRIYLYRPQCSKIEGDIYYFSCSYAQVEQYFRRFGEHAIVLSPNKIINSLKNYYYFANKAYNKIPVK